jgi:DNA-binding transcriptional LysR family regulator
MNISHMKEFLSLADTLNFSRSADELFMAQSVLTRHIQGIEEEFGVRLFSRSTHGVALLDEGRIAYSELAEIVAKYDALAGVLASRAKGLTGNLRIGILYYAIEDYMESIIGSYERSYPNIEVSIESCQPPQLNRDLLAGRIDVGLTHRVSLPNNPALRIVDINSEPMIVLLSEEHRLHGKTEISVVDLKDDPFVFMESEPWHEPYVTALLQAQGLSDIKVIHTEQIDTLANTVINNNAVSIVAGHLASINRKRIEHAAIVEKPFSITMSLAYLEGNDNPALEVFLSTTGYTI